MASNPVGRAEGLACWTPRRGIHRYASVPASAFRIAPMTTLAAGLARNMTALAISRGSAYRLSKVMPCHKNRGVPRVGVDVSVGRSRLHWIDGDILRSKLAREAAGEGGKCCLRHGVVGDAWERDPQAQSGPYGDDAPPDWEVVKGRLSEQ